MPRTMAALTILGVISYRILSRKKTFSPMIFAEIAYLFHSKERKPVIGVTSEPSKRITKPTWIYARWTRRSIFTIAVGLCARWLPAIRRPSLCLIGTIVKEWRSTPSSRKELSLAEVWYDTVS